MLKFIKLYALLPLVFLMLGACENKDSTADKVRPNIILIVADDLGWKDLSCYGNDYYETPVIDQLANKGVRFTQAYAAAPVCSPTRASIVTGKYPARLKLTNYLIGKRQDSASSINPADFIHHLPLEEVTVAEKLEEAGYISALVGKWHLANNDEPSQYEPQNQGFDFVVGGRGSARQYFYPDWLKSGRTSMIEGDTGDYITNRITDEALQFMEENKDTTFFLDLSHYAVHIPLQAPDSLIKKYENKENPKPGEYHPIYAAMIESMDYNIGRIFKKVEELGIQDNTIIIFTSDNGGLAIAEGKAQPTTNEPLRNGKGTIYEGGIRVPTIIYWPGKMEGGKVSNLPVISNDFLPTIAYMAGIDDVNETDGENIYLNFEEMDSIRSLYWHYPHFSNQGSTPAGAVRKGDYKLILRYENYSLELYNLAEDISESNNLANQEKDIANELYNDLKTWLNQVDANMPTQKEGM